MTQSERWKYAAGEVFSPAAFFYPAVQAAVTQADDKPHEWGQGAKGFARRYSSGYAGRVVGQSIEQTIAFAMHEDNRYFASGMEGTRRRIWYAASSTFLARHDDGSRGLSFSSLGGAAGGSFLTRSWQPRSTSRGRDAAVSFALTMAVRVGLNEAREFGPKFLRTFLK
ncbi:MAG TPA: hypothetical protein VGH38_11120 [Bryobacteraceae bacterium]